MASEIRNSDIFGLDNILKNVNYSKKNEEHTFNKQYENRVLHSLRDVESGRGTIIHNKKEDDEFWNSL